MPDFAGKSVLDVGCDHGYWSFLAAERGASYVLGLDRNRKVNGVFTDIVGINQRYAQNRALPCLFHRIDLGKQWLEFRDNDGDKFDIVFCLSMYHHFYENCGSHEAVWFWLWRHTEGELLWENPVDRTDEVVRMNVTHPYRQEDILASAQRYFNIQFIGKGHVPTREVWRCTPRDEHRLVLDWQGKIEDGTGGATAAFTYADNRRISEIENILGVRCVPGSLNIKLSGHFIWDSRYFRAAVLDVVKRGKGLDVPWEPRWARFYPVKISEPMGCNSIPAYIFRFEGESYPENFVELISEFRLRDQISGGVVDVRT